MDCIQMVDSNLSCSDNNFKVIYIMAWYRGTGKENHRSVFENIEYDRCIFCNNDRTEIAKRDFTIVFSEFEYNTGSICKSCYHANAKMVKAV